MLEEICFVYSFLYVYLFALLCFQYEFFKFFFGQYLSCEGKINRDIVVSGIRVQDVKFSKKFNLKEIMLEKSKTRLRNGLPQTDL